MATTAPLHQPMPFLGPGFFADPYPFYAWLRATDPVHRDEATGLWLVSRYADVAAALNDSRLARGRSAERVAAIAREWPTKGRRT